MHRDATRIRQWVNEAWYAAMHGLRQMNQGIDVQPTTPYQIFTLDAAALNDVVKLNAGPVVFNVPERPNRRSPDLFIVIKGWLIFEGPDLKSLPLRTKAFGTEVAYFRAKAGELEHVYGAHYDIDEVLPGHPVFHAQMGTQIDLGSDICTLYRRHEKVVNGMGSLLRGVRTPTAQMDIFSVVTQIGADHLLNEHSAAEVRAAFNNVRNACDFLIGAAHRMTFFSTMPAIQCYRSTHWYKSPAANV